MSATVAPAPSSSSSSSSSSSAAPRAAKKSIAKTSNGSSVGAPPESGRSSNRSKPKRRHASIALRAISRQLGLHNITTVSPAAAGLARVAASAFAAEVMRGALLAVASSPANHSTIDSDAIDTGVRLCLSDRTTMLATIKRSGKRMRSLSRLLELARSRRASRREKYHKKLASGSAAASAASTDDEESGSDDGDDVAEPEDESGEEDEEEEESEEESDEDPDA